MTAEPDSPAPFAEQWPRLFGLAYRMLGSAADADAVLQDAWGRWSAAGASVPDQTTYLTRTVTTGCLSALDSARVRRKVYVGPWLPEPVLTGAGSELGPQVDDGARRSISFAVLVLLERLSPTERAAYVLCEAFGHGSREAGDMLGAPDATVRRSLDRARTYLGSSPGRAVDPGQWRALVERFLTAAHNGDRATLTGLLAVSVTVRVDGGGRVTAARNPVRGTEKVARHLLGVVDRFAVNRVSGVREVNGGPAVVATVDGRLASVWFLHTDGEQVTGVDVVLNPDKLARLSGQLARTGGLPG